MSASKTLNPHNPAFDPFMYASLGEDRKGARVTVLSALARLNLDPWAEAAALAGLGRVAAEVRLNALLMRFFDMPTLTRDHAAVAHALASLLPDSTWPAGPAGPDGASSQAKPALALSFGLLGVILGVALMVIQIMVGGASGPGQ